MKPCVVATATSTMMLRQMESAGGDVTARATLTIDLSHSDEIRVRRSTRAF
jgi:hypothetical protein